MPQGIDLMIKAIDQNGGSVPPALKAALKNNMNYATSSIRNLVSIKETQPANIN